MRINKIKSKNQEHYSIIKNIKNVKRPTCDFENIGNLEKFKKTCWRYGVDGMVKY